MYSQENTIAQELTSNDLVLRQELCIQDTIPITIALSKRSFPFKHNKTSYVAKRPKIKVYASSKNSVKDTSKSLIDQNQAVLAQSTTSKVVQTEQQYQCQTPVQQKQNKLVSVVKNRSRKGLSRFIVEKVKKDIQCPQNQGLYCKKQSIIGKLVIEQVNLSREQPIKRILMQQADNPKSLEPQKMITYIKPVINHRLNYHPSVQFSKLVAQKIMSDQKRRVETQT